MKISSIPIILLLAGGLLSEKYNIPSSPTSSILIPRVPASSASDRHKSHYRDTARILYDLNLQIIRHIKNGEFEKAERPLERSVIIFKKLEKDHGGLNTDSYQQWFDYALQLAGIHYKRGSWANAAKYYNESMAIAKSRLTEDDLYYHAGILSSHCLISQGKLGEAESLLNGLLLAINRQSNPAFHLKSSAKSALAQVYMRLGKYALAEQKIQATLTDIARLKGENSSEYASQLDYLTSLYFRMDSSRWPLAIQYNHKARSIHRRFAGSKPESYLYSLLLPVNNFTRLRNYSNVEQACNEADSIIRVRNLYQSPAYGQLLERRAFLFHTQHLFVKAREQYLLAASFQQQNTADLSLAWTFHGLATLYMDQADFTNAEKYLLQSMEVQLTHVEQHFRDLSEMGKLDYLRNNYFTSMSATGNSILTHSGGSGELRASMFELEMFSKGLILEQSLDIETQLKNEKDPAILELYYTWKRKRHFLSGEKARSAAQRTYDIKILEREADSLETLLNFQSKAFLQFNKSKRVTIADIKQVLRNDDVAIEFVQYQLYDGRWTDSLMYGALILAKNFTSPVFVPLFEEKHLRRFLTPGTNNFKNAYRSEVLDEVAQTGMMGDSLYTLVWKPLEKYVRSYETIHFAPAGLLNRIAFHALPVSKDSLLADRFRLHQLMSTRQLVKPYIQEKNSASIALFGNPTFTITEPGKHPHQDTSTNIYGTVSSGNSRGRPWEPLKGSAAEVEKILELFKSKNLPTISYTKTEATEDQLKSLSGSSPRILHIATHGYFISKSSTDPSTDKDPARNDFKTADDPMMKNGIVLAGANHSWAGLGYPAGNDDGIVTAYEVAQLDLRNTELAILSACETALGDLYGTEGVFGLQRALKMAGVKQVILSLWPVPDEETAILMSAFYKYYLASGNTRQSFEQAQKEMRKQYPAALWAAFVLLE